VRTRILSPHPGENLVPFDSQHIHPEALEDAQSHPCFCRLCYEVQPSVNFDQVCMECAGDAEDDDADRAPSAEYLMKWERTW
jgi:hypothetical protein